MTPALRARLLSLAGSDDPAQHAQAAEMALALRLPFHRRWPGWWHLSRRVWLRRDGACAQMTRETWRRLYCVWVPGVEGGEIQLSAHEKWSLAEIAFTTDENHPLSEAA